MSDDENDDYELGDSVPVSGFSAYVNEKIGLPAQNMLSLQMQYGLLATVEAKEMKTRGYLYEPTLATARLNRYMNILPNNTHRVKLKRLNNDEDTEYINASFVKSTLPGVKNTFIATQAPVRNSIPSFWRMIAENCISLIVMLTRIEERAARKADRYWPTAEEKSATFGTVRVDAQEVQQTSLFDRRTFTVTEGKKSWPLTILQYKDWPDHGVPSDCSSVFAVLDKYRQERENANQPILIHCSAGVGRTGSFIAIDFILDHLSHTKNPSTEINVFNVVRDIRRCRPTSVQTADQYIFIHRMVDYCIQQGAYGIRRS